MQLLPTFIIVSLLGFFVVLTVICIFWHWRRSRTVRKRRRSNNSYKTRSTRHLTVEGTKVVNVADALEKGGLENEKADEVPYNAFSYEVKQRVSLPASIHSPRIRQASNGSRNAIYGGPQIQDIVKVPKNASSSSYLGSPDTLTTENILIERSGSLTLPRPALINIERRGSGQSSRSKKLKRKSQPAHAAQPWYGRTPSGMAVVVELPASPVTSEKASLYPNSHFKSSALRLGNSGKSSRRASAPSPTYSPPSFSPSPGQRVTFAPTQDAKSRFSSSTVSPGSSSSNAPPSSTAKRSIYHTPPSRTPKPSSPDATDYETAPKMVARLERPPSLDVDIPHVAPFSFFNASFSSPNSPERPVSHRRNRSTPISSPTTPHRPSSSGLNRSHSIRSVMSSRSVLTIASSEISSNWTIGDAQAVGITPCIGPDEQADGEVSELEGDPADRQSPPYAKTLRSKYGKYPRGRRDKALPTIPRSPLSKSFGLDYGGLGRASDQS